MNRNGTSNAARGGGGKAGGADLPVRPHARQHVPAGLRAGHEFDLAFARPARGFTLIELILVLAILSIVTALAAPSLFNFFRGRTLDSEAQQLLALTHAGQSRAVSEGFPMLLWIDSKDHAYGLQAQFSSQQNGAPQDADPKAEQFAFSEHLQIQALNASTVPVNGQSLPAICFLPDGTIDSSSPNAVRLTAENGDTLWLVEATNRLSYAIQNNP